MAEEASMAKDFAEKFTNGETSLFKSCAIKTVTISADDEEHFLLSFGDGSAVKVYPDMVDLVVGDE